MRSVGSFISLNTAIVSIALLFSTTAFLVGAALLTKELPSVGFFLGAVAALIVTSLVKSICRVFATIQIDTRTIREIRMIGYVSLVLLCVLTAAAGLFRDYLLHHGLFGVCVTAAVVSLTFTNVLILSVGTNN